MAKCCNFNKKGKENVDLIKLGAYAGAILSLISLISAIYKFINIISRLNDKIDDVDTELRNLQREVGGLKKSVAEGKDNDELQNEATKTLLRQHIIRLTDKIINRKVILTEEIYCLRNLNDNYTKLGGNSTVDERVKLVMKFPSKDGRFVPPDLNI